MVLLMKFKAIDNCYNMNVVKFFVKQHNWSRKSSHSKTKFKWPKTSNIIAGVCCWARTSLLAFEDNNRITYFWKWTDNNLFRIHKEIVMLNHKVMRHCRGGSRTSPPSKMEFFITLAITFQLLPNVAKNSSS